MDEIRYQPEELIPIVAELAEGYTGHEHSSVTYETAQMLMNAVLYCINEYEESDGTTLMGEAVSAKKAYEVGYRKVQEKAGELRKLYSELIAEFDDYGLECLKDTIVNGIPAFLFNYDIKYAPQETLLTLDYPTLRRRQEFTGVDAVLDYVQCVSCEQRFLQAFNKDYIIKILNTYHGGYKSLIENICEIVIGNTMGHVILGRSIYDIGFSREEYDGIEKILSGKTIGELEEYIGGMLDYLSGSFFDGDASLSAYLKCCSSNIAVRIKNNLQNHCPERVFLI